MRTTFITAIYALFFAAPGIAQQKLYPVRPPSGVRVLLSADRAAFVVEKPFEHRLTVGFPSDDRSFIPETDASLIILSLRIQNVSERPLRVDISRFSSTDDQGRMYASLAPGEAADLMIEAGPGGSLGSKALRGISLGRAANKQSPEDFREDILRYSLRPGEIPPGGVQEGLIYFQKPPQKTFTFNVVLGGLWSQPLVFSTEKQK